MFAGVGRGTRTADSFRGVTPADGRGREEWPSAGPFAGNDLLDRIVRAPAGDAAALVLDMPWPQTRAVLNALGPREVARLLLGVRADRVAELLGHLSPELLSGSLAYLSVAQIAELVPLVPVESAVRVVTHLAPDAAAALLLALPTQHRLVLQERLPPPAPATGGYRDQAEQAVRRTAGRVSALDPRGTALLTEVFGRPIQVLIRDRPATTFGAAELPAAIGATDWQRVAGVIVLTNAALDPTLPGALREARQRGYVVEVVQWQDERDDGILKRTLVRLIS